jgi:4-hydroxythreonine-4-phosphate dehydrogenase
MGDACGIGPEIIAQWWPGGREAVVVGCPKVMARAVNWMPAGQRPRVRELADLGEVSTLAPDEMGVWAPPGLPEDLLDAPLGQVDVRAGRAAAACIREAVRLAQTGAVAGIVTAPLHKEALALAGEPYPGHTELLQAEGSPPGQPPAPVRMMLANDQLKTVLVTIHMSLQARPSMQVTFDSVLRNPAASPIRL